MEDTLIDGKPVSWLDATTVLILVLMEDTLRDALRDRMRQGTVVLILVLMEDTLRVECVFSADVEGFCLNPCFNGRYS